MSARTWASVGNLLRVVAVLTLLAGALGAARFVGWLNTHPPASLVVLVVVLAMVDLAIAALFWMAKGPLVSGNPIARMLAAIYMLVWIVSTLGLALIFLGLAYLMTSEPDSGEGVFRPPTPVTVRFAPPTDWQPSGRVGPSGAMLYSDENREASVGIFDSNVPVQVMDRRNGLAHVVAATGQGGWIDVRTLTEGA